MEQLVLTLKIQFVSNLVIEMLKTRSDVDAVIEEACAVGDKLVKQLMK